MDPKNLTFATGSSDPVVESAVADSMELVVVVVEAWFSTHAVVLMTTRVVEDSKAVLLFVFVESLDSWICSSFAVVRIAQSDRPSFQNLPFVPIVCQNLVWNG